MKKIIAILMAGIMLLSFAACGGNNNEEETTKGETTVAETTTSPMVNADTRFSHKATMKVWTNGKKVAYEAGATKIMTATATLNDSVIHDTLTVSDAKADVKAMKKASCVEITYEKDQIASFSGKKVTYDQIIVSTDGKGAPVNTIFFLKDGATAGAPIAVKAAEGRKTLSENLTTAVEIVVHEGHTH